nr:MAG TPA: hypothetical protein [Caudoviricetes sp.]
MNYPIASWKISFFGYSITLLSFLAYRTLPYC